MDDIKPWALCPSSLLSPGYFIIALQMVTLGAYHLFLLLKTPPFIKHPSQALSDPPCSVTSTMILTPLFSRQMNGTNCCELGITFFPLKKKLAFHNFNFLLFCSKSRSSLSPLPKPFNHATFVTFLSFLPSIAPNTHREKGLNWSLNSPVAHSKFSVSLQKAVIKNRQRNCF